MRILVTGAHGCIGSWIVKGLLDRNLDVVAFDLDATPARLQLIARPEQVSRLTMKTGRIEDSETIKALVRDEGITHVIHLAAVLMPFCQANPVTGGTINVVGTLNVFEAARDAGRPVRVVYASSAAVWGKPELYGDRALTEEDALKPETHYGVFKRMNEENARVFWSTNQISSVGLRPWTVYGVGRDAGLTGDPTLAMRAAVLEQPFHIRLSGHMDFQFVEDVAEAFIRSALADFPGAHVFNLAGEIATIEEFQRVLTELDPPSAEFITAGGPEVPVAFRISDERIRSFIPELPKTTLREGMRSTLDTFRRLRKEQKLAAVSK